MVKDGRSLSWSVRECCKYENTHGDRMIKELWNSVIAKHSDLSAADSSTAIDPQDSHDIKTFLRQTKSHRSLKNRRHKNWMCVYWSVRNNKLNVNVNCMNLLWTIISAFRRWLTKENPKNKIFGQLAIFYLQFCCLCDNWVAKTFGFSEATVLSLLLRKKHNSLIDF